jgi:hypothetical protein
MFYSNIILCVIIHIKHNKGPVLDTSKEMTKETDTRKTSNKNEIPLQSQLDQGLHAHFLT